MTSRKSILCVGLCCVDLITVCKEFPLEDSDQRCVSQRWARGGNAANDSTVLCQLATNNNIEFLGVLSQNEPWNSFLKKDFESLKIGIASCPESDGNCPASVVILSQENGSRTIVHNNGNLRELTLEDFQEVDISKYSWIHFEGRNIDVLEIMLQNLQQRSQKLQHKVTVSLEIEKTRPTLEKLIPYADVLFVSKDFCKMKEWNDMKTGAENLRRIGKKGAIVIVPWGEVGASVLYDGHPDIFTCPAYPPQKVVDTLGAGDTFIAGTIYALSRGLLPEKAIDFGCRLAGYKVGISGLTTLSEEGTKLKTLFHI